MARYGALLVQQEQISAVLSDLLELRSRIFRFREFWIVLSVRSVGYYL